MGFRETSYYGWQNVLERSPNTSRASSSFVDSVIDVSGNIYVVGSTFELDGTKSWNTLKSENDGKTWSEIDSFSSSSIIPQAIDVDSSGAIYVVGCPTFGEDSTRSLVRKSHISASSDWFTSANGSLFVSGTTGGSDYKAKTLSNIAIDSNDNIYIVGRNGYSNGFAQVWKSLDRGVSFSASIAGGGYEIPSNSHYYSEFHAIHITSNDKLFVGGRASDEVGDASWAILSSSDGNTWELCDYYHDPSDPSLIAIWTIGEDSSGNLYAGGSSGGLGYGYQPWWFVRKSSTGVTGSWSTVLSGVFGSALEMAADSMGSVYFVGYSTTGSYIRESSKRGSHNSSRLQVYKTVDGSSFIEVDNIPLAPGGHATSIVIDNDDNVYTIGVLESKRGIVRKGKLTANSASLGPSMLATSVGYVFSETSGTTNERFKLNNISEFPHAGGAFQMRNMILGTVDSGKIGNTDDSIVQVQYFGSVVNVLWPKQSDQNTLVKGFGDLAPGQRAGKLTTTFEPGDSVDVTKYDHLALYCMLQKRVSGTLDNIEIKIERRPLKSTGFSVEQNIELSTSGSYSVAELQDVVYKKAINYGDLSISEVGFPIDVPLENSKEIRVQVRHTNGQDEENKNLIIWGRFIKSEEET